MIVIAAAGGEVADEEDVQRCDVLCLTLFFQEGFVPTLPYHPTGRLIGIEGLG